MPEIIGIKEIQIRDLNIPQIPNSLIQSPQAIPPVVPVTQQIGTPIVNLPGCVEAHPDSGKSKTLAQDDENGTMIYCDATIPSFNPIEFEPEQMILTNPSGFDTRQKEGDKTPETSELEIPKTLPSTVSITRSIPKAEPNTQQLDCPTAAQQAMEPVGTYTQGFRKKITGYSVVGDQCIQITEGVPIPQQIIAGLPSAGTVMTTSGIAVVATASALMAKPLADVLLKVIKPTVKKVMKKIAAIRGKQLPILSVRERQDLQRERTQAIRALKSVLKPKG